MARHVPDRLVRLRDPSGRPTDRFDNHTFACVGMDHEETLFEVLERRFPERDEAMGLLEVMDGALYDA